MLLGTFVYMFAWFNSFNAQNTYEILLFIFYREENKGTGRLSNTGSQI